MNHGEPNAAGRGWRRVAGSLLAAGVGAMGALAIAALSRQFRSTGKTLREPIQPRYGVEDEQFLHSIGGLLPPPIVGGNEVTTLLNGDEIFPAMLEAIENARRSITMETYIYWSGRIAERFADALASRSRAGVACHLLLDWFGSMPMDHRLIERMSRAGVEVHRYHRQWWNPSQLNHRTHRKLLIVDGKVGFTGGVGIADHWTGHAQDADHWRDNHYRVYGPAAAQLQSAFTDNWLKASHTILHDENYFPPLETAGDMLCQTFQSSPEEGSESMRMLYLLAMTAAQRSIRIATAYFVPDDLAMRTIIQARRRGVEIDVISPGRHTDVPAARRASRERWSELLDEGVRLYEYQPTMYHCKAMIVDDIWTSIGSANFDNRSFRLNDEANLNVYDRAFAAEQLAWFDQDRRDSRRITERDEQRRGPATRAADQLADAASGQL